MQKINSEEYLTFKQISLNYNIKLSTLYGWKDKGLFSYAVIDNTKYYIKKSDFEEFIKNKQKPVFHNKKVRGK